MWMQYYFLLFVSRILISIKVYVSREEIRIRVSKLAADLPKLLCDRYLAYIDGDSTSPALPIVGDSTVSVHPTF
jgi:hypothetical protein